MSADDKMDANQVNETVGKDDDDDAMTDTELEEAEDQLGALDQGTKAGGVSTLSSIAADLNAELDVRQRELLKRVRKSVHIARGNSPNLRLAVEDEAADANGMKMVDIKVLLGLIEEESVKIEVEKEMAKSKKMAENISKLLFSEGFL